MINVKELRIGNWVQDFGDGIGKVISVFDDGDSPDILTTANRVVQPPECIYPIVITEEILLENFNFELEVTEDLMYYHPSGFFIFNLWKEHGKTDFFAIRVLEKFDIHLSHVHQLQNLYFSITGEELTYTP